MAMKLGHWFQISTVGTALPSVVICRVRFDGALGFGRTSVAILNTVSLFESAWNDQSAATTFYGATSVIRLKHANNCITLRQFANRCAGPAILHFDCLRQLVDRLHVMWFSRRTERKFGEHNVGQTKRRAQFARTGLWQPHSVTWAGWNLIRGCTFFHAVGVQTVNRASRIAKTLKRHSGVGFAHEGAEVRTTSRNSAQFKLAAVASIAPRKLGKGE